ncbi:hypothetical protein BCR33DRAFT_772058 [Rhizoclosmatium globosum]|uniref:Uncharacterized protein n=1 Tax=Rhizoclosmatium globosum TaxID=329046 RepID=A0A1Y2B801_9FUNG|nr:hypothetical protein BCR33DRAFT_772058 [Rhizoclosmatium globosum]|eukprot:ORY30961.1 hypothetical protein BCR33DRAFT_772058 [Rhizoclosmatium globosum]
MTNKRPSTTSSAAPSKKRAPPSEETGTSSGGPGSLDVAIPSEATPAQILSMAKHELSLSFSLSPESNSNSNSNADFDDVRAVAQKLLEETIAKLESANPVLETDDFAAAAAESESDVTTYSDAAVELAALVGLDELARRILGALKALEAANPDLAFVRGRAAVEVLAIENKLNLRSVPKEDFDQEEDDEDDNDEELDENHQESEEETRKRMDQVELLQSARSSFITSISLLKKEANEFTLRQVSIAQLLRSYALAVRHSDRKSPIPVSILTFALSIVNTPFDPAAPLIPDQTSQDSLSSTKASLLYYLARFRAAGGDEEGATQDIKECIRAFSFVVDDELRNQEMVGQAYLFLSTVTPNDTLAIAAYSKGTALLRAVLASDPLKKSLKAQLEQLGATSDEADEEEELLDEDGNVFDLEAEIERDEDDGRSDEDDDDDEDDGEDEEGDEDWEEDD